MFLVTHRRGFAGRPGNYDCVRAVFNLVVDNFSEFRKIYSGFIKRSNYGNAGTGKNCSLHGKTPPENLIQSLFYTSENFAVLFDNIFVAENANSVRLHAVINEVCEVANIFLPGGENFIA